MSDRKVTTIHLARVEHKVSYENLATLELNDCYKAGRKAQPRIVLRDMTADMLAHLINRAGQALRDMESNVANAIERAKDI